MAREKSVSPPPRRKEPGLLGKLLSGIVAIICWLIISLLISVIVEWIGIRFFWPEQGSQHAQTMLEKDTSYLHHRVANSASVFAQWIRQTADDLVAWVEQGLDFQYFFAWLSEPTSTDDTVFKHGLSEVYAKFEPYVDSVPYTIQVFLVRLAIVVLSLPSFLLFGAIGLVDGLVERDLRRWGGGRESSVVYNLARKSVFRLFIFACVVYLSFPITIAPSWIIIPFAITFGLSLRITFERFKKYF